MNTSHLERLSCQLFLQPAMPRVQMLHSDTTLVSRLRGHIRIRVQHNFNGSATTHFQIVLQMLRLFQELTHCRNLGLHRRQSVLIWCSTVRVQPASSSQQSTATDRDLGSKSSHLQSPSKKRSILSVAPSLGINVAKSVEPLTYRTILTNCRQLQRSGFFNRLHLHRTTNCKPCLLHAG